MTNHITIILIVIGLNLVAAEWLFRTKKDVAMGNVLQRFQELSMTQCQIRCKLSKKCKSVGMAKEMAVGKLSECFLLADEKDQDHQSGLINSLYVIRMNAFDSQAWILQEKNLCIGSTRNSFATFRASQTGTICAIRFEHVSGKIYCENPTSSLWGCPWKPMYEHQLSIIVTDVNKNRIFPRVLEPNKNINYDVAGYGPNSKAFQLVNRGSTDHVSEGDEINVWYAEDIYGANTGNNKGATCAKVYVKFNC